MSNRRLCLEICDYTDKVICNLYDNLSDVSGQAADVFVRTERNGWKELNFTLPSTCNGDEGIEENYRLKYLIADYKIRLTDDYETDWYIISEPKVQHNAFSKDVSVTAGHVSQWLKNKRLDLEFSDEEGNNVGTPAEFLDVILDGTGWRPGNVATFYEDDGVTIKNRSLNAAAKSGAFKLISDMCELFDAKAIYHGDKTVDILPMNPFSREVKYEDGQMNVYGPIDLQPGEIPSAVLEGENVFEMHYDRNTKGITRTLNTENLVTKLTAYGNYGDENGLCSLQKAIHGEYKIQVDDSYDAGTVFKFTAGDKLRYFKTTESLSPASKLIFSDLDYASMSYVWNEDTETAYHIITPETSAHELEATASPVVNHFSYLMNFKYYDEIGLLTEEMFQKIAKFQREMPEYLIASEEASAALIKKEQAASTVGESMTGLAKLDIKRYERDSDGALKIILNKSDEYPDGVIYRTDYDEAKRHYFSWHVASKLKANGDPVSGIGSVLFIIHDTEPITFEKVYLKQIDELYHYEDEYDVVIDEDDVEEYPNTGSFPPEGKEGKIYVAKDTWTIYRWVTGKYEESKDKKVCEDFDYGLKKKDPSYFSVWADYRDVPQLKDSDRFYLLCTNSMMGYLGSKQVEDESTVQSLASSTKVVTKEHPTYFEKKTANSPSTPLDDLVGSYGWCYVYDHESEDIGDLYFFYDAVGDAHWQKVYCQDEPPVPENEAYYFSTKLRVLYHGEHGEWVKWDSTEDKRIAQSFTKVNYACRRREMLYKGIYEEYHYTVPNDIHESVREDNALKPGNYAFDTKYGFYWTFSTDKHIPIGDDLWIDTLSYNVYQTDRVADVVPVDSKPYDTVTYPSENIVNGVSFTSGGISDTGVETQSSSLVRSHTISVYENTKYLYNLPNDTTVYMYDVNKRFLHKQDVSGTGSFITRKSCEYIRFVSSSELDTLNYVRIDNYQNIIYLNDQMYTVLSPITPHGMLKGIYSLTKDFADLTDEAYEIYLKALLAAQQVVKDKTAELTELLGDMYREGWWEKSDYVSGDEEKLYTDAMDNLGEISKPKATYDVNFLDLFSSNKDMGYSIDGSTEDVRWPDIHVTDAVHLVDPEIDINLWAYFNVINKCYDKPWETTVEIDTSLSLFGQHSFTDVMTSIAEVADRVKSKEAIYDRAEYIGETGVVSAAQLQGALDTSITAITSGQSNSYTDEKGRFIFESADGMSAMMLTGAGFLIAASKNADGDWEWRTAGTGKGIVADEITSGTIKTSLLQANSITANYLHASVGQELDIGSNKALLLYATEDGFRPAGSVLTPTVEEGDSYIAIGAKSEEDPAYINIMTGGIMNVQSGSTMNISSGSSLNVESNSNMNIKSGGNLVIESGGYIDITASENGKLTISSPNFSIDAEGNVTMTGSITASEITGGTINGTDITGGTLTGGIISGGTITIGSNFSVDEYGVMTAKDGAFSGDITSSSITSSSITIGENFSVDTEGNMTATNGSFTGDITSTNADITGIIRATELYVGNETTQLEVSQDGFAVAVGTDVGEGIKTAAGISIYDDGVVISSTLSQQSAEDIAAKIQSTAGISVNNNGVVISSDLYSEGEDAIATALQSSAAISVDAETGIILSTVNQSAGESATKVAAIALNGDYISIGCTDVGQNDSSGIYITPDSISIDTGGSIDVNSGGAITVNSGSLAIASTGTFTVDSENFDVDDQGNVSIKGVIKATNLYLGADQSSDGTQLNVVDSLVVDSSITTDTIDSTIQSAANISVSDKTGIVLSTVYSDEAAESAEKINTLIMDKDGQGNPYISIACMDIGKSGSSIYVTPNSIDITSTGTFTIDSENFDIDAEGNVTIKGIIKASNLYLGADQGSDGKELNIVDDIVVDADITSETINETVQNAAGVVIDNATGFVMLGTSYETTGSQNALKVNTLEMNSDEYGNHILISCMDVGKSNSHIYITPETISISTGGSISIASDGEFTLDSLYFDVDADGVIKATAGTIGGWTISETHLASLDGNVGMSAYSDDILAFWAGAPVDNTRPFFVTQGGYLYAQDACIEGVIIAGEGGYIGGWYVGQTSLTADNGYVGMNSDGTTDTRAFWAGSGNEFYVTHTGYMYSVSGSIGGWSIGQDELTSNYGNVGISSTTTTTAKAFWAGDSAFYVTPEGYMYSQNAYIEGTIVAGAGGSVGGWDIGQYTIYSGNVGMNSNSGDMGGIAFWAGSGNEFYVTHAGYLHSASGEIGGWSIGQDELTSNSRKVGISSSTSSGARAFWAGTSTDSSDFYVTNAGYLFAKNASIGGWSVDATKLSRGSGSSYVALSSSSDYAIWAGNETDSGASFRVKQDGTVYAKSFVALSEPDAQGHQTESNIDLSGQAWKLNRAVKTLTNNSGNVTIGLYNGTSINFKNAASVTLTGEWSGNVFTVTNSGNDRTSTTGSISLDRYGTMGISQTNQVYVIAQTTGVIRFGAWIEANDVYNKGWNAARANQTTVGTCYRITAHQNDWVKVEEIGTGYSRVPTKT